MGRVFEVDFEGTTEASDDIVTVTGEDFESVATATDELIATNVEDFGIGDPE